MEMEEKNCLIFLSHSGFQKHIAEQLFNELKRIDDNESSTFFDRSKHSIPIGGCISDEIEKAIKTCKLGVVLLSKEFIESHWPMKELDMLVSRYNRSRCNRVEACIIYPLFYDLEMKYLKDPKVVLNTWGRKWAHFQGIDTKQWAKSLCQVRWMRGEILHPNLTVADEIHRIACSIAGVLQLPPPPPRPDQVANSSGTLGSIEILKLPAKCQYTTLGSLFSTNPPITFFMHPTIDTTASCQNLLGQHPNKGARELGNIHTLKFKNEFQLRAYTKPIEGGNEWWELMWCDRGRNIHPSNHTCWRLRVEQIPNDFVCVSPYFFKIDPLSEIIGGFQIPHDFVSLSPYFFKIDTFHENMGGFRIPRGFLSGEDDDHTPPSNEDVNGMVAINKELVSYIPGEKLIKVWDDRGSGATQDLSIYTGPDFIGCFAFQHHQAPIGGLYPILDKSKLKKNVNAFTKSMIISST